MWDLSAPRRTGRSRRRGHFLGLTFPVKRPGRQRGFRTLSSVWRWRLWQSVQNGFQSESEPLEKLFLMPWELRTAL